MGIFLDTEGVSVTKRRTRIGVIVYRDIGLPVTVMFERRGGGVLEPMKSTARPDAPKPGDSNLSGALIALAKEWALADLLKRKKLEEEERRKRKLARRRFWENQPRLFD